MGGGGNPALSLYYMVESEGAVFVLAWEEEEILHSHCIIWLKVRVLFV